MRIITIGEVWAFYYFDKEKKALKDFDKAISLNPKFADAYDGRSKTYLALGENAKADSDLVKYNELIDK